MAVVVGLVAGTLVCCVLESSVGAVVFSVDMIFCDLVNGVVDVMFSMLLSLSTDIDVELIIEMLMLKVGSEEALTRGLEAADTTRSKTSMKTIGDNIFPP